MKYELRDDTEGYVECRRILARIDDDGTETEIGYDRGEPEDNSFGRDWSWVPDELNRLAAIINGLRGKS